MSFSCAGDETPPAEARPTIVKPPEAGVIRVAGTGAMEPRVRALAAAWRGPERVVVEESIGSGGAVRAVAGGAIDLGTISRPLAPSERSEDLVVIAAGRDVVVLAANPSVGPGDISADVLRALHTGERRAFPDGTPAVLFLRDRGESANGALDAAVPGLAAAREAAYRRGRARVLYSDRAMIEALAATPGAIGVTSLGALGPARASVKVLSLDGCHPERDPAWPAARPLAWVARRDRLARVQPFLDLAAR